MKNLMTGCAVGALALACATQAAAQSGAQPAAAAEETTTVDSIVVVGSRYGYQPVDVKQDSAVIVDSVTYDDIEAPTGDNSIASLVLQAPGVSYVDDGDEPRYITIRGLSADLNSTTIDGLTLATLGESGTGTRRVNLQLAPSDVAQRVDVFKAFTAEEDAAGIGGQINIITRSAFSSRNPYFMLDAYGIYTTFEGPGGENSAATDATHWGKGLKTAFARTFGPDDQFGVVFTARYQDRARNSNKNWPDQRVYFNDAGAVIGGPDPDLGWDGRDGTAKFAFGDFNNVITNEGASLKLEWRPRANLATYVMGYHYNRREASTMNSTDIIGLNNGFSDRTETTGTVRINYIQHVVRSNQWDRTASGVIGGLDWNFGLRSDLSLRAGYTRETFDDDQHWVRTRTRAGNPLSYVYRMDGLPQMTGFIGDPFASDYFIHGSDITYHRAAEDVLDLRADYAFNVGRGAQGFGFKAGVRWTQLELGKDQDSVRYDAGGDANAIMYNPNYSHYGSNGVVLPWINYERYWNGVLPTENLANSRYYSLISDYSYDEDVANAYLSLHYKTDRTHVIAGVRYDDVSFEGQGPLTVNGVLTDDFSRPSGGYSHWLPSFNVVHDLTDTWKLRGSVSRTLGRPTPADIVQAETQVCGEEVSGCTITRGNPDLKPRLSTNYDLALEYYFPGRNALAALTVFRKEIEDDIFTLRTEIEEDGVVNLVRQPMNAETSEVQGIELALVNRAFSFNENLGASFNVTAMTGEMSYATDAGRRQIDRLVHQPDWMANLTATYRIPRIDGAVRVSANYQDDFLNAIGATPWADHFAKGRTTVDLSFWHRVSRDFIFKYELDNVFYTKPERYHGRNVNGTLSQRDHYGQGVYFHIVYSPWN